jgi:hypothetical protein
MNPLKSILIISSAKTLASFILACLFGASLLATEARGARGRPQVDQSLGFNVILSDKQTLLRGVSISFDGGDPYGSLPAVMPTQLQLDALAKNYGLNTLHLYLEGDSAGPNGNNDPVGYNAAACDLLVQRCAALQKPDARYLRGAQRTCAQFALAVDDERLEQPDRVVQYDPRRRAGYADPALFVYGIRRRQQPQLGLRSAQQGQLSCGQWC